MVASPVEEAHTWEVSQMVAYEGVVAPRKEAARRLAAFRMVAGKWEAAHTLAVASQWVGACKWVAPQRVEGNMWEARSSSYRSLE